MALTTTQVKDLMLPGLDEIFGEYKQIPAQWSEIFEKRTSDMAFERDVEMRFFGLAQAKGEGQAVAMDDGAGERYMYVYRWLQIGLAFVMTKFAIRDNLYKSQFNPQASGLKRSMAQTKEVYGANVLNNATDTSGNNNGGDGVPLLSTAHPIDVGTVANTPAVQGELNESTLQDALIGIRRFKDAAGMRFMARARKLVITPELEFVTDRILRTPNRVGTSDNDINAVRSMISGGYVVNDFLTNTKSWYVLTDVDNGLKYYQRDPLETDMHVDFMTDNLLTKATERYGFGWSNFRGIYGNMP